MKRGPYKGQYETYRLARNLRSAGYGYRTIAKKLENTVSYWTIRNWCQDIKIEGKTSSQLGFTDRLLPIEELKSNTSVRKRLVQERGNKCEKCGINEWQGGEIIIEVHHKDGNKKNNCPENLELLCPNCHSQTDNYKNNKRV